MGYYMRGDYYRGDYYRGDPFLGGLIGAALPIVGKVAGKVASWVTGGKLIGAGGGREALKTIGKIGTGVAVAAPVIKYGAPAVESFAETAGGWFGGRRKYRRMNPLNPRALRRALRRAEGFEKFARRTVNALYRTSDGRRVKKFKKRTPSRG